MKISFIWYSDDSSSVKCSFQSSKINSWFSV